MRFYILSDLHLDHEVQVDDACRIIKKLCCEIRKCTSPAEPVLFIILGDIANKGEIISFERAEICLGLIQSELKNFTVKFEFVPGNHDLDKNEHSLHLFDQLTAKYGSLNAFQNKAVFSNVYENVNFIFADSTLSRNYKAPGKLDLDAIKQEIKVGMSNILFCHHALTQGQSDTHDNVENSTAVYNDLKSLSIEFYFHGHTHRVSVTAPPEGLVEISCGSFSGDVSWEKSLLNQFSVGYIQDGSINSIQRWVDVSDGSGSFAEEQIYPISRGFADPDQIGKICYEPIRNYIPRGVLPYEEFSSDMMFRLLSKNKKRSLAEVVECCSKVLLLSDAGMGKSVELQNVAYILQAKWHTFFFSLKNYSNQNIVDIIPKEYVNLCPSRYILLFDGYDELSADCREIFEKNLALFDKENPGARIVISSRSNFCRLNKGECTKFPGYKVFVLDRLNENAISIFLEDLGIDKQRFYAISQSKNVFDLLSNPFYLTSLTEILLKDGDLPEKTRLMERLIEMSFCTDNLKFPGNLDEHYRSLFCQLEKLAFSMQLMQRNVFNDHEEYQDIFSFEQRELVKNSGLLKQVENGWSFLHNNFREYLTARFLSKLQKNDAISIFSDETEIKPSWVNTLGYLTGMNLAWNLEEWLNEHSPSALVKFESDRLSNEKRTEVFKFVYSYYEKKSLYFNDEYCDERELASFANNVEVVRFLMKKITKPLNIPSQCNAIDILRYFQSLFGMEEQVKDCLKSCCKQYPKTPKQVCRLCLAAFSDLKLYDSELTNFLFNLFGTVEDDYIRFGMYEYLNGSGNHNLYVEYFIEGIKYIKYSIGNTDLRIGNERFELLKGLKSMSTIGSITNLLKFFSDERHLDFYDSDEIISVTINTASRLYGEGAMNLYKVALDCYITSARKWNSAMTKGLSNFFVKTNTLSSAVVFLVKKFSSEVQYIGDLIHADTKAIEYLKDAYLKGSGISATTFIENVVWYVRDADKYEEYAKIINDKDNLEIPKYKESINYELIKFEGTKSFVNSLFDKNSRVELLLELVETIGDENISVGDLIDMNHDVKPYSALWYLQSAIYNYGHPNLKVREFFDNCDIDQFIVFVVAKHRGNKNSISLSVEQEKILEKAVKKIINQGIFNDAIKYHENGYTCTKNFLDVLSIIISCQVDVDEDTLLRLIEIPAYHFNSQNNSFKYEFLELHLGKDKLKHCILLNVKCGCTQKWVLEEHISYFDTLKDSGLVETALTICKITSEYSNLRRLAWKYLYNIFGIEFISSEIVPYVNGDFLVEINQECKDIDKKLMCCNMEDRYRISPSMPLLAHMIRLESEMALNEYLKQVKKDKRVPECDAISIDGPTAAIASIKNPKLLSILHRLFKIAIRKGFVDLEFRGLKNSLMQAFINCDIAGLDATFKMVNKLARKNSKNKDEFQYCNYVIDAVIDARKRLIDKPLSLDEVKCQLEKYLNRL